MSVLPTVMLSNLVARAERTDTLFPDRVGMLFSPDGWMCPRKMPYALDNGRYPVWSKGKNWDEPLFWRMIERAISHTKLPSWIAVPDVVTDAVGTFGEWERWVPRLETLGIPLALVVQNGMTPAVVNRLDRRPDVIFVGGTTTWKRRTLRTWTKNFLRVHVGRINTENMLWKIQRAGVESSDGTGWWHHRQYQGLLRYLRRSSGGKEETDARGFFY